MRWVDAFKLEFKCCHFQAPLHGVLVSSFSVFIFNDIKSIFLLILEAFKQKYIFYCFTRVSHSRLAGK